MAAPEAGAPVWTTHAWSGCGAWEQKDISGAVSRVWPPEPEPEQQPRSELGGDEAYSGITLDLARSFSWSSDLGAPTPEEQELLHELGREFGLGDDDGEPQSPSPSPVRCFASRKHLRAMRQRDARQQARVAKVDVWKLAAKRDSALSTTLSSCSELFGGSAQSNMLQRRGSSPSGFADVTPVKTRPPRQRRERAVALAAMYQSVSDSTPSADGSPAAERRMSPQFKRWRTWAERNSRNTSRAAPSLPTTPELAGARGHRVAAGARRRVHMAMEGRHVSASMWKGRKGQFRGVRAVLLDRSGVTDQKAQFLGKEMGEMSRRGKPVHVSLAHNWIKAAGAKAIAAGLALSNCASQIQLQANRIGGAGGGAFAALITPNSSLQMLDLGDNPLGLSSFEALGDAISRRASLTTLRLDNACVGSGSVAAAIDALGAGLESEDCSLQTLSLQKNSIRSVAAAKLFDALAANTSLRRLDLARNAIGDKRLDDGSAGPAERLGEALKENSSLTTLGLEHNNLGDDGAAALAACLEHSTANKLTLRLNHNMSITSVGCARFLVAKKKNFAEEIVVEEAAAGSNGPAEETAGQWRRVELLGCFSKMNVPASLLLELGML